MEQLIPFLRITGLRALAGAFLYAIGDVLLLANKATLDSFPGLRPSSFACTTITLWNG